MKPLAENLRPQNLADFFGQSHLLNDNHPLKQAIDNQQLHSMILWGPSGTGKTTLARIIARQVDGHFEQMSAVLDGVKELRAVVENAKKFQNIGKKTLLFVDEIHRFNKAQQDGFLPHIESGLITLIGATTENPSFELNRALLSRLSVYVLNPLNAEELHQILDRALVHENIALTDKEARSKLINASSGDARRLVNIVEQIALAKLDRLDSDSVGRLLQEKISVFDKGATFFISNFQPFTNRYADLQRMALCTGWPECWWVGAILKPLPDVCSPLPLKILGMPILGRWKLPLTLGTCLIEWGKKKAIVPLLKQQCIVPLHQNLMQFIKLLIRP